MTTLLNWATYWEHYTAYKCKGEMTQLFQSTKGKGSSRRSSRGDPAVLSQAFPCSLLHQPGQVCQWAPGTPELRVWDVSTALPPLTACIANRPLPRCYYRTCSWLPWELHVVQKIQVSYALTCVSTITPCTMELQPLPGSRVDSTWHNSMPNQSICIVNLNVRDMKISFWKVS